MTHKKLFKSAAIASGIILILMFFLRDAQSEIFTALSVLLGAVIFYSVLYYLFQTEKIKTQSKNPIFKYLFFGITIPLLIYGVEVTRETGGFLQNTVRIALALEISYLLFYWIYRYAKGIQKLKSDKLEAELMLLKNQINPHFFFNTLNNLYSLIKKDQDQAQDYVLKLSDLMRFTIYESSKDKVTLKDEMNYLINFIDLQTSRYHKEIDINFEKSIKDPNSKVAPLLFIILLENAFKHGVEKVTEDAFIHLKLVENENKISFVVKNNFDTDFNTEKAGIGLKNLEDRLQLIYPNAHRLTHHIDEDIYTANLVIYKK